MDASTVGEAFRRGAVSPLDHMRSVLGRIAEVDGEIRAYSWVAADAAIEDVERRLRAARRSRPRAEPLHAIPVSVKDVFHVAGMPTRAGTGIDLVTDATDSRIVRAVRRAGATIIGKTQVPELGYDMASEVRNPWRTDLSAGWTSAGAAAAVAAGMGPLAVGSDTAGSVRIPAAFCGVVGFKPTSSTHDGGGGIELAGSLDVPGLLARSVGDIAVARAVIGDVSADPAGHVALPGRRPLESVPIGVARDLDAVVARDAAVDETLEVAEAALVRLGARLVPVPMAPFAAAREVSRVLIRWEAARFHAAAGLPPRAYSAEIAAKVESGAGIPQAEYDAARAAKRRLADHWRRTVEGLAAVLLPTVPASPPAIGAREVDVVRAGGSTGRLSLGDYSACTVIANIVGAPAISLPCVHREGCIPISVQFTGREGGDRTVMAIARSFESERALTARAWA